MENSSLKNLYKLQKNGHSKLFDSLYHSVKKTNKEEIKELIDLAYYFLKNVTKSSIILKDIRFFINFDVIDIDNYFYEWDQLTALIFYVKKIQPEMKTTRTVNINNNVMFTTSDRFINTKCKFYNFVAFTEEEVNKFDISSLSTYYFNENHLYLPCKHLIMRTKTFDRMYDRL